MRLVKRLWRGSVEREVDDELEFHLEMATRELMQQGLTRPQARAEAERRFGDSRIVTDACRRYGSERDRKERRAEHLAELRQDVSFSLRQLVKAKGFTAVAVTTLALGIGATAAMFSALDAVVLRKLPFADPASIVNLHPQYEGQDNNLTPPEYLAFREAKAFQYVAAARLGAGVTLELGDFPEMIDAALVSADYFAVFGVRPLLGRTFTREEDVEGGPGAAILSHDLWVSRFNADPAILNRVVRMNEKPHTIVGIMPASFDYRQDGPKVWVPLALGPLDATRFGAHYLSAVARLRPGVSVEQARAAARVSARSLAERIPGRTSSLEAYGADVRRFSDDLVRDYRSLLLILFGAVGFVLFIACGNVANLLLARGATRARELAVRAALGAGRARLFRQLLTESVILAMIGAAAGLAVAFALIQALRLVAPPGIPRIEQTAIDWRVFGVTLLLGAGSSLLFGLAPAWRATRAQLQQAIREGGRGSGGGRDRLRPFLIGAQVALTIALLTGAGLLLRSAWRIQHVDPGFDPRAVLTARIVLPEVRYKDGAAIVRAFNAIREEASRIPEAKAVAVTSVVPLSGSSTKSSVQAEGTPDSRKLTANLRLTSAGYFDAMRIPLIAGRDIERTDVAESTPVAVISQSLARALWPGRDPRQAIGKRISAVPTRREDLKHWEVVGIVGDLHDAALTEVPIPEMHTPFAQTIDGFWPYMGRSLVIVLRHANADAPPEALVNPLKAAVTRVDPSLPLADSRSMPSYLRESLATARMNMLLLSTLGGIALVLAMVGIYGVVAYFVSQRTQEIGIRIALGSTPADTWAFVVRRGMMPVVAGLAAGIALSLATSTLLRSQLFGVSARDPVTLATAGLVLLVVAILAMYVPARRAMRVSPIVALGGG